MTRRPDFDDLVGQDVPPDERERLRRTHELLLEAGPLPELSPEMDAVPWPDDALQPLLGRRRPKKGRRVLLLAAALVTAVVVGFVLGQATTSTDSSAINARKTVELRGTPLASGALATLKLGKPDEAGNWPMVLHVSGLPTLPKGGYYALYLTKGGRPLVSCGTINVSGATSVRLSAAYVLETFDKDGWVIVRQTPANHFRPNQIVLRAV
jgi:Anti-sigma-K factor rskA, C-terminal